VLPPRTTTKRPARPQIAIRFTQCIYRLPMMPIEGASAASPTVAAALPPVDFGNLLDALAPYMRADGDPFRPAPDGEHNPSGLQEPDRIVLRVALLPLAA
jgi:hypothetical protein